MKQTNKAKLNEIATKEAVAIAAYEQHTQEVIDMDLATKSMDPMASVVQGNDEVTGTLFDADVKTYIDALTLKSLFFSEDWVHIVVDLIASKISALMLRVMRSTMVDGKKHNEPAEDHPLQALINDPNKYQDYHTWMYNLVCDYILIGNSIQWYQRAAKSIMALPAEAVTINFDSAGAISEYVVYNYSAYEMAQRGKGFTFVPGDIAHIRRPNPGSLIWGLSPFVPGRKSVLFNRYSQEYLNNFYLKGATPGIALEMDKEANEGTALRLLRSFEQAYTGRRNQRRTMVLPKGVTAKEFTHTIADQQLVDLVNMNRETILGMLKVPKHEVGLQEAGSLGSEEAKTALKNFWYATLKPACILIEGSLTKFFTAELGPEYFLEFDLSTVEALKDDELKKATLAKEMLFTHTLNEVRKKVYDEPPLTGGDATPSMKLPASSGGLFGGFGSQGGTGAPEGLSADLQAPQGSNLFPGGVDSARPQETSSAPSQETKDVKKVKDLTAFKAGNDGWFSRREAAINEATTKSMSDMESLSVNLFKDIASALVRTAKRYLSEKGYKAEATKASETGNPKKVEVTSRTELRRKLRDAVNNFETRWIDDNIKTLESLVELGYDVTLNFPFNMPSQNEIAALRQRGVKGRRSILEERSLDTFANMNRTTTDKVLDVIDKGVEEGKTIDQIASDISDKFKDIESVKGRAQTIARTETLTAVSLGQAAAMQDAAKVVPDLQKMWITADDDRVRDSHAAVDGEVRSWDEAFTNDLFFPRDPGGPPEEVINCRCTFVTLPKDQMDEVSGDNLVSNEGT